MQREEQGQGELTESNAAADQCEFQSSVLEILKEKIKEDTFHGKENARA